MKNLSILFLFFLIFSFTEAQNLEQQIIAATDAFLEKPNDKKLETLNSQIPVLESKLTSQDEYYEFIYLLVNKGYYQKNTNRLSQAISTYEKAYTLYRKHKVLQFDIVEYCLIDLGTLYHRTNNYTNAENTIKQYISIAESNKNNAQRIVGSKNLANLYQKLGKHKSTISIIDKAVKIKGMTSQKRQEFEQMKSMSLVALNKSQSDILNNDVLFPDKKTKQLKLETEYALAKTNGNYQLALKHFIMLKGYQNEKDRTLVNTSKSYFEEAQLQFLLGNKSEAAKKLQSAIKILIPDVNIKNGLPEKELLFAENTFIDIFDLLAELQTNPENKIACYNLSFYVSELLEKNITDQQGKLINLTNNRNRSEQCITALYKLSQSNNNPEYISRAFAFAEKHKTAILNNIISTKTLLKNNPNDSLLIKQQELLKAQENLQFKLLKMPFNSETVSEINGLRDSLSTITIALKGVYKIIEKEYPLQNSTVSLNRLVKKLSRDDATFVEYFFGQNNIYQFIISDTSSKLTKIPLTENSRQSISTFIDYFNSPSAINNNIPKYTEDAFKLYQLLQLNLVKSKQNLIIVPDGFLNFIPFDALLTDTTTSTQFEAMPFVVKLHKLAYSSSANFYLKESKQSQSQNVLGVFPVFENSPLELKYSINEAKSLKKEMNVTLLINEEATKKEFLNQATNFDVLHLSTHASSGDFIEPAHIEFIDSKLYLNELYALDLNTELVVLSACETGIGVSQRGEGVMSVARGFQYAGAKNIVFSLWQISDLSTSQLMGLFYKKYDDCASAYEANYFSKLAYLNDRNIKNIKKSPYYWSAFTYHGALTKVKPKKSSRFLILSIIIVIVLFLLWLYKSKYGK